jgi:hypothetical protein
VAGEIRTAEEPQRLPPKPTTIRDLAAHSGNQCAFPGCEHVLVNAKGQFVAQVCHIEAASPGGPRFNPEMSNEERRHRDNLVLMCLKHHIETHDADAWPVERLTELKATHERRYKEGVTRIPETAIVDITKAVAVGQPQNLIRFGKSIARDHDWNFTAEELRSMLDENVLPLLERLRKLAPETREVLLLVLERGENYGDDLGLPTAEIEQVTARGPSDIQPHIDTMTRYGIASYDEDFDGRGWIATHDLDGWPFWRDLKRYCDEAGIPPSAFVRELRFELLD